MLPPSDCISTRRSGSLGSILTDENLLQHTDFTNDPSNDFISLVFMPPMCLDDYEHVHSLTQNSDFCFPRTNENNESPDPIVAGHRRAQRRSLLRYLAPRNEYHVCYTDYDYRLMTRYPRANYL